MKAYILIFIVIIFSSCSNNSTNPNQTDQLKINNPTDLNGMWDIYFSDFKYDTCYSFERTEELKVDTIKRVAYFWGGSIPFTSDSTFSYSSYESHGETFNQTSLKIWAKNKKLLNIEYVTVSGRINHPYGDTYYYICNRKI